MPKLPSTPSPSFATLTNSMLQFTKRLLPESMMAGAIKFKDLALGYLSEISFRAFNLSHNQAAIILGLVAFAVILYFAFIDYVLR